ncbi:MFS general substrate transporter [Pseudohyphozyma bogoriensis]|nr:MFS general substrate transporter [Pseudohyphozyma bogoriensis]
MPTSPTTPSSPMRGSYVLHHIDSCHQHEHDDGDDGGDVTPRHSSERTLGGEQEHEDMPPPIPGDVEKGGMARKQQSRAEDRDRYVPPGERHWPDNIVSWDSPTDRANPMNWSFRRKYLIVVLLGMLTMCSTFASAIFSSAIEETSQIYGVSTEVMTLGTSLFIAGYIPGPIVFAPISEMYGRRMVLLPMFIFLCFSAATATADRLESIMITRFFAGVMASAPVTTLFNQRERGSAVVLYSLAVVAGPTLSPVIGAAVSQSYLGWRWTEYLVTILTGTVLVLGIIFVPETFGPVLLTKKAQKLRRETGRWELHSRHEMNNFTLDSFIHKNLTLPIRMVVLEPMVLCITLYNATAYGVLYLLFGAVPIIFQDNKGWNALQAALPFLGVLVGTLSAAGLNLMYSIFFFAPYVDSHNGVAKPEMRLPPMMLGGILFPAGFFLLGWAPTAGQIFGLVFIGASFLLIFQSGINFLIDTYAAGGVSASAVAANTFMRSIFAAALPLVAQPLFNNLGYDWACTLLGCLAATLGCVPFLFFVFGEKLRGMSRLTKSPAQRAGKQQ